MSVYQARIISDMVFPKGADEPLIMNDLVCGKCGNILYGFDEDTCPSCGAVNSFDNIPDDTEI